METGGTHGATRLPLGRGILAVGWWQAATGLEEGVRRSGCDALGPRSCGQCERVSAPLYAAVLQKQRSFAFAGSGKRWVCSVRTTILPCPWSLTSVAPRWTSKRIHVETARDLIFTWFWYKTWKSPSWQCLWRANLLVKPERASSF